MYPLQVLRSLAMPSLVKELVQSLLLNYLASVRSRTSLNVQLALTPALVLTQTTLELSAKKVCFHYD